MLLLKQFDLRGI